MKIRLFTLFAGVMGLAAFVQVLPAHAGMTIPNVVPATQAIESGMQQVTYYGRRYGRGYYGRRYGRRYYRRHYGYGYRPYYRRRHYSYPGRYYRRSPYYSRSRYYGRSRYYYGPYSYGHDKSPFKTEDD